VPWAGLGTRQRRLEEVGLGDRTGLGYRAESSWEAAGVVVISLAAILDNTKLRLLGAQRNFKGECLYLEGSTGR
jgi:hypothetical protein